MHRAPQVTRMAVLLALLAVVVSWLWSSASSHGALVLRGQLTFFYQPGCHLCEQVEPDIQHYRHQHPRAIVEAVDMSWRTNADRRRAYDAAYGVPDSYRLEAPALFVGGDWYVGVESIHGFLLAGRRVAGPPLLRRVSEIYGPWLLRLLLVAGLLAVAASSGARPATHAMVSRAVGVLLGAVLLVSSVDKIGHPLVAARDLAQQWHVPTPPALLGIATLVLAEAAVGLLLLTGRREAAAGKAAVLLFLGFLAYVCVARALAIAGDCGCFPWHETLGFDAICRNFAFLVLAVARVTTDFGRTPVPSSGVRAAG